MAIAWVKGNSPSGSMMKSDIRVLTPRKKSAFVAMIRPAVHTSSEFPSHSELEIVLSGHFPAIPSLATYMKA
jgi:hypothetical protein